MLRAQWQIAPGKPFSRAPVQFAAPCDEERSVHAFLDEGMREKVAVTLGPHEQMVHQFVAPILGVAEHGAQRIGGKALTEDGGGLNGAPVFLGQPVYPRQHKTLHGPGNAVLRGLFGSA